MNNLPPTTIMDNISVGGDKGPSTREVKPIGDSDGDRSVRSRADWGARPPVSTIKPLDKPIVNVLLTYTKSPPCEGQEACDKAVRDLQTNYQTISGISDLPFSFLISKDGLIYEGRGWDLRPFVPMKAFPRLKGTRIVIAHINEDFDDSVLPAAESATWDLIQHGVDHKYIHPSAKKIIVAPWV